MYFQGHRSNFKVTWVKSVNFWAHTRLGDRQGTLNGVALFIHLFIDLKFINRKLLSSNFIDSNICGTNELLSSNFIDPNIGGTNATHMT